MCSVLLQKNQLNYDFCIYEYIRRQLTWPVQYSFIITTKTLYTFMHALENKATLYEAPKTNK